MTIDWNSFTPGAALAGGVLIGLAASLFVAFNGRIAGISGILGGLLRPGAGGAPWRLAFLLGLVGAPLVYGLVAAVPTGRYEASLPMLLLAGWLVGIGTRYGAAQGFSASAELVGRAQQFDSNNVGESRRAFRLVNASLGYTSGAWTATLWAKNLLNTAYDKRVYFFGNADPDYIPTRYEDRADPRQLGVTVGYKF